MDQLKSSFFRHPKLVNFGLYAALGIVEMPLLLLFGFVAVGLLQCHPDSYGAMFCRGPHVFYFSLVFIYSFILLGTYITALTTKIAQHRRIFLWINVAILIGSLSFPFFLPL